MAKIILAFAVVAFLAVCESSKVGHAFQSVKHAAEAIAAAASEEVQDVAGEVDQAVASILHETGKDISESKKFFVSEFYKAKVLFEKVVHSKEFHVVVDELIQLIDSKYTEEACDKVCVQAADKLLGREASVATPACPHVCKGALSKLKNLALKNYPALPPSTTFF